MLECQLKSTTSSSLNGLMTIERWNNYLFEWCLHILQPGKGKQEYVMAFALIPDGFTIQKVTAAQERAVKSKATQDDLIALINNPQTIAVIGTVLGVR